MNQSTKTNGVDLLYEVKHCAPEMQDTLQKELTMERAHNYLEAYGIKAFVSKYRDKSEKKLFNEEGFWPSWGAKLLFTLISVKFWGLVTSISVTTWLLVHDKLISGGEWVTFNTTVWGLIFGMKEVFRIAEGRDKTEKKVIEMTQAPEPGADTETDNF